jgi:hypothetical protein
MHKTRTADTAAHRSDPNPPRRFRTPSRRACTGTPPLQSRIRHSSKSRASPSLQVFRTLPPPTPGPPPVWPPSFRTRGLRPSGPGPDPVRTRGQLFDLRLLRSMPRTPLGPLGSGLRLLPLTRVRPSHDASPRPRGSGLRLLILIDRHSPSPGSRLILFRSQPRSHRVTRSAC